MNTMLSTIILVAGTTLAAPVYATDPALRDAHEDNPAPFRLAPYAPEDERQPGAAIDEQPETAQQIIDRIIAEGARESD